MSSALLSAVVDGRDRRLELVLAHRALLHGAVEQGEPLGDQRPVPQRAILLGQRDQLAVGVGPRGAPGVDQQHQREQPGHLGVVGQQPLHDPGQPDRLRRQLGALQARGRCCWRSPR